MTNIKRILSMLAVVALVGCGDSENAGTPPFGSATPSPTPGTTVTNLSLNLSAATINNSGSETVTATVTATNENNQTLAGAAIVLKVDNEAEIAVDGTATDANGQLTGTVRIGDNHQNRTITVTAVANDGTLQKAKSFQVVGANLTGTLVPAVLTAGAPGVVKYRLVDSNSNPMAGVALAVTGPGGAVTNATTGANGDYDYGYTAPATAGDLVIHAVAAGDALDLTVLVTTAGGGSIPPVQGVTVRSASVSANPTVVPVNIVSSTTNQAQIRALFLTDQNAPVRNIRVRFDLAGDINSIGGTFGTGANIVYSDPNGVATTSYIAGSRASPTDGLTVRACWDYVDFAAGICPNAVTTTLTVTADPVSITIGTDNKIDSGAGGLTYIKKYVVQVVDSSGLAKPDVQITPAVDLLQYLKGNWVQGSPWTKIERAVCDNEDINRNNTSEVYSNGQAEDANGSFNLTPGRPALEPRKADVAVSVVGSSRTDSTGVVVIQLQYPKNLGSWVNFNLQVSASGVSATEGRANFEGLLPVLADDVKDATVAPPFEFSPYGVQPSATITVQDPQSGKTGQLCINPN